MPPTDKDSEVGYVPDDPADEKARRPDESAAEKTQHPEEPAGEDAAEGEKKKHPHRKHTSHLKEVEASLHEVGRERDELKDKYLRALAEMDNFSKRIRKEKEDYQKYVLGAFLLDLLPVYDNLERALKAKSTANDKGILAGVEIIFKQLQDLLKKYQVSEIEALGQPFDPHFHQALAKEEAAGIREPQIIEVYQKGFLYQGKVLRPVLAKVGIPAEPKTEPAAD